MTTPSAPSAEARRKAADRAIERRPDLALLRVHWAFHKGVQYEDCAAQLCLAGKHELAAWMRTRKQETKETGTEETI